jgi:hypothetical protein
MVFSVRSSLFWDVTQSRMVVVTHIWVQAVGPILEGQDLLLKTGLVVCPETSIYSVDNFKVTL